MRRRMGRPRIEPELLAKSDDVLLSSLGKPVVYEIIKELVLCGMPRAATLKEFLDWMDYRVESNEEEDMAASSSR